MDQTPNGMGAGIPTTRRYDVVVIGAGAFGLAAAYHIRSEHPSEKMLVIDARSAPGEGSTGASAAMVRNVFTSSDNRNLANSSIDFYRDVEAKGEDLGLDLYGYLWLLGQDGMDRFSPHVDEFGPGVASLISLDRLRSMPGFNPSPSSEAAQLMELPAVAGGILGHKCGAIAPEKLTGFYYRHLLQTGAEFLFDACATRLGFDDRTVMDLEENRPFAWQEHIADRVRIGSVEIPRTGPILTDHVVLAAGAWIPQLIDPLGIDSGARPRARSLFAVQGEKLRDLVTWRGDLESPFRPRPLCPFLVLPTGTYLKPIPERPEFWVGHADYAGVPFGARENILGGTLEYDPRTLGRADHYLGHVGPIVSEYLSGFRDLRPTSSWGGYYGMTPDGLPYVFEQNGVLVVAGDSGSGVMKADAVGRIAATLYGGHRFATLHGGLSYDVARLGCSQRTVETERFII